MNEILQKIQKIGIVPVVVLEDVKDAVPLANALIQGGLPCAEVTFRTEAAEESIRQMVTTYPEMLVGAGTILSVENVKRAVDAGAKFIVSPGFDEEIITYCLENDIPVTPGTTNPSEVGRAVKMGLDVVKFFPAEAAGGLNMIKSIAAPFTKVKFMPTGGISAGNINTYLSYDRVIACGGSWMVSGDLIKNGDFAQITQLTKEAVMTMLGFELGHVGINCDNELEANQTASSFAALFGLAQKQGGNSIFAGTMLEVMKQPYLGKNGHIAVKTNDVLRAKNYLETQNFLFNEDAVKYQNEKLIAIYLKDEIGGFAVHLLQK